MAKTCKNCKLPVDQWPIKPHSTLAKVCSIACTLDLLDKKKSKEYDKVTREKKKSFRENDTQFLKAKAQKTFNEFIRLRDKDLPCVSCDKPADWHGQFHCGHYKTIGARPDLRFNENNCQKQCSVCNNYLSGNLAEYRIELERRIGIDAVLELERDMNKPKAFRANDYKQIHEIYQQKIKELKAKYDNQM